MGVTEPAAEPAPAGADLGVADTADGVVVLAWWQNPVNVVVMLLAGLMMAAAIGWSVGHNDGPPRHSAVDTGFLQDMRYHHEQAFDMSIAFLDRPGTDPGLRTVARTIVRGQGIEIGRMIEMLREAGEEEAAPDDRAMDWMGMPTPLDEMPGMAAPEDLDRLIRASGREADELFVELMTAHHEGGIEMAEYEADHGQWTKVRSFATAMAAAQRSDVAEMNRLVER